MGMNWHISISSHALLAPAIEISFRTSAVTSDSLAFGLTAAEAAPLQSSLGCNKFAIATNVMPVISGGSDVIVNNENKISRLPS